MRWWSLETVIIVYRVLSGTRPLPCFTSIVSRELRIDSSINGFTPYSMRPGGSCRWNCCADNKMASPLQDKLPQLCSARSIFDRISVLEELGLGNLQPRIACDLSRDDKEPFNRVSHSSINLAPGYVGRKIIQFERVP